MQPTRRLWAVLALAGFLAAFAVATANPLLLAGVGLIGAWILTQQYRFLRTLEATCESLQVHQSPARTGIRTGDDVPVVFSVTRGAESPLTLEIEGGLPTAAVSDAPLALSLQPSESSAERTVTVSWPVAGRHRFDEPTVTAANAFVRETMTVGNAPTVTANPRGPRTVHVGEGGDRLAAPYGEHEGGRRGSGIEPAELREYLPGDTMDKIDWKATARLSTPYVREYEAETDRRTMLLVDHRASLGAGEPGESKLEYLRDVALAVAASARRLGDPVGFLAVGDEGVTTRIDPATTPATYNRIRTELLDLEPTETVATNDASSPTAIMSTGAAATSARRQEAGLTVTPAEARAKLAVIDGNTNTDTDAFAETLRPFYAARDGYRRRIESDPLCGAVETVQRHETASHWMIICTDDSRPQELRETVKLARSNGNTVMVLLAPTVLYERGGLADVERAYDRYVEFEELRRELARMPRVTALEVGPKDRLATILSGRRTRGGRA